MKTIYKLVFLFILTIIIGYQLTTIEGYPSNSYYTVPSSGKISDKVINHIKTKHPSIMFIKHKQNIKPRLDELFNEGLAPALVVHVPPGIEIGTVKYDKVMRTLRKAMNLPDATLLSPRVVYVYRRGRDAYEKFFGKCSGGAYKNDPEGSNCK
jgi:hypothetical protein